MDKGSLAGLGVQGILDESHKHVQRQMDNDKSRGDYKIRVRSHSIRLAPGTMSPKEGRIGREVSCSMTAFAGDRVTNTPVVASKHAT